MFVATIVTHKCPAGHWTQPEASESQYSPAVQLLLLQEHSVSQSQAAWVKSGRKKIKFVSHKDKI